MSYNGSGTFQINTSGQPVVAGTVISSTAFNALTADLATGLSTAITKDGQTTATARIPFAAGISSTLTTDSSSVSTGSIITAGGAGIAKALYVGTTANVAGAVTLQSTLGVTGVATFSAAPIYSSLTASSAVATDASKGLVSVTNTGTGNNVLATSPTLTTPALGTPSALVLTNATGLPRTALPTGSVLQVVNATFATAQTTTSTSYQASGLAVSITPTSNTSKIFISASVPSDTYGGTSNQTSLTLYRGATDLITNGFAIIGAGGATGLQPGNSALNWLDSPATTSSTTYTIYHRVAPTASGTVTSRIFTDSYAGSITVMEIAV